MSEKGNFPYTVKEENIKDDGKCCDSVSPSGWHRYRCGNPVKEIIDGVGFCGIHARSIKKWRFLK